MQPMSYVNGLPYITNLVDKGALKHKIHGDLKQHWREFFKLIYILG